MTDHIREITRTHFLTNSSGEESPLGIELKRLARAQIELRERLAAIEKAASDLAEALLSIMIWHDGELADKARAALAQYKALVKDK